MRASPATLTAASVICGTIGALVILTGAGQPHDPAWVIIVLAIEAITIGATIAAWHLGEQRHAALLHMTECDPATGCLNRRGFARALDATMKEAVAMHGDVALLALDLDHFKQINDRYGHNVGDVVLSEVAATLAATVGSEGMVARVGGEEFLVLLPNADAELAGVMAEQLVTRLRAQRIVSLTPGTVVTMSVGIAAEHVTSLRIAASLRARADEALYVAKRGGRDRIMLWAPGVRSNATPAAAAAAIVKQGAWPAAAASGRPSSSANLHLQR
jgi:diguanylate cyclase (GGDEF)-like protein